MKAEKIIEASSFGCDFSVLLPKERKNGEIRILQLTDIQIIDSNQRRTADRLRSDEINAWEFEKSDGQYKNHIRSLVAQSVPDLIFITGDIVYGQFDDNGSVLKDFCEFMDSLRIPWAPVFGNHDNESKMGVKWQCEQFEKSEYCLFKRGTVSGNGNYTVGIFVGDEPVRILHMLDSNGCADSQDPDVIKNKGIFLDQMEMLEKNTMLIEKAFEKKVPSFAAFHIPVKEFEEAEIYNGYKTENRDFYTIGVDVKAKKGDFGFKLEKYGTIKTDFDFVACMKKIGVEGVFTGHCHNVCTVMEYKSIKWIFGLKTGQYDYHIPGQLGGTLVRIDGNEFSVTHIPSLVHYAPFPGKAKMFDNFFEAD